MKFTCSVEINLPVEKVIELFDNPDNFKEWQDGFVSFEHLSGAPGQPGAKSRLVYKSGRREIEMYETITVRDLPREFSGIYEAEMMVNSMKNHFVELGPNRSRLDSEVEYTELKKPAIKLMAWLFPGMFKKQVQKWMNQFRDFAEKTATLEN